MFNKKLKKRIEALEEKIHHLEKEEIRRTHYGGMNDLELRMAYGLHDSILDIYEPSFNYFHTFKFANFVVTMTVDQDARINKNGDRIVGLTYHPKGVLISLPFIDPPKREPQKEKTENKEV